MQILVDADSCPKAVKEILFRAAERRQISMILIANTLIKIPDSVYITNIEVDAGLDIADDKIVELTCKGDLIITADIPLADRVVEKGAYALNPRGSLYTEENIREIRSLRDFSHELRNSGVDIGGPANFNHKDRQAFANQLDRFLTKQLN